MWCFWIALALASIAVVFVLGYLVGMAESESEEEK